jgi:hypothetical protein
MTCSNQYLLSLLQCGFPHRARLLVYTNNMDHGV